MVNVDSRLAHYNDTVHNYINFALQENKKVRDMKENDPLTLLK